MPDADDVAATREGTCEALPLDVPLRLADPLTVAPWLGVRLHDAGRLAERVGVSEALWLRLPLCVRELLAEPERDRERVCEAVRLAVAAPLGEPLRLGGALAVPVDEAVELGVPVGERLRVRDGDRVSLGVRDCEAERGCVRLGVDDALGVADALPLADAEGDCDALGVGDCECVCERDRLRVRECDCVPEGEPVALWVAACVGEGGRLAEAELLEDPDALGVPVPLRVTSCDCVRETCCVPEPLRVLVAVREAV